MRNKEETRQILVLVLWSKLEGGLVSTCPFPSFKLGVDEFCDAGYGDFPGFYDWLRNENNEIIGVRFSFFENVDLSTVSFASQDYVDWNSGDRVLSLFFSESRDFIESKSDDQDFGCNRLYFSAHRILAISLSAPRSADLTSILTGSAFS